MSEEKNRKRKTLLQTLRAKVFIGVLIFAEAIGTQQKGGILD